MRVIAGKFRSRSLKSLKGLALRPTSDRLRETLFNVLADRVPDARFVDAFAGTGAVGIEALSRGAREVIFIENHAPAVALIRENLQTLGIQSLASVLALDALRGLRATGGESSDGLVPCGHCLSGPAVRRRTRLSARLDVSWRRSFFGRTTAW